MLMREQLKIDIDMIDEQHLVVLQQIINLFKLQWVKQDSIANEFAEIRQIMSEEKYDFPTIEKTTRANIFSSDFKID